MSARQIDGGWFKSRREGGTGEFPHLEQQRFSPCDRNHMAGGLCSQNQGAILSQRDKRPERGTSVCLSQTLVSPLKT